MMARRHGMDVVALRFPFISNAERAADRLPLVAEDPAVGAAELWTYLDVRDAAQAAWLAMTVPLHGFHKVFVAAPDTLVPYPTADLLRVYHPDVEVRAPMPGRTAPLDLRAAQRLLGFQARHLLEVELLPWPAHVESRPSSEHVECGLPRNTSNRGLPHPVPRLASWRGSTTKSARCCGSTPTSSCSAAATLSGRAPMRRPPGRSAAIRGTWRVWTRPRCARSPASATRPPTKISEYLASGRIEALEALRAKIPPGVREITQIPGVGPKTAVQLYRELGIKSVEELRKAVDEGKLKGLAGLGEKTVENIRHGIEQLSQASGRTLLNAALDLAEDLVAEIGAVPGCKKCDYAGSLRRMRETVGDIDILATATDSAPLMAALLGRPEVADVIGSGTTKTSIRTDKGLQVDLRVVPPGDWGAALIYFTGSRAHNIKLRGRAVKEGLKLSEYGLFDVETGKKLASRTEKEVYKALGLPWIPPTLREDRGEIEAALEGELPDLVQLKDLRGDLHTHTDLTDGLAPLEVMLQTAADLGYAYYAVTDHAPNLVMQRMTDEKMLAQRVRARELDRTYGGMRVLHGTELNIDAAGDVDWPAEFLAGFDICVASIHSSFGLPAPRRPSA